MRWKEMEKWELKMTPRFYDSVISSKFSYEIVLFNFTKEKKSKWLLTMQLFFSQQECINTNWAIYSKVDIPKFRLRISNHWARNQCPGPLRQNNTSYTFLHPSTVGWFSTNNQANEVKESHPKRLQILTMLYTNYTSEMSPEVSLSSD